MPVKAWAIGEDFLASDINSYLQNQAVQVFPNASMRNTAITTPSVGMVTFLADTGGIEVYTDKTTPSSWRPPWNTAWGLVYHTTFGNITLGSGAGWLIRSLPMNLPGRYYKAELDVTVVQSPSGVGTTTIRYQSQAGLGMAGFWGITAGWAQKCGLYDVIIGSLPNEVGYIASVDANTIALSWGRVRVYDVGPV